MIRYDQVVKNLKLLPNFISYYEGELTNAKNDCKVYGSIESRLQQLPGITEHRFNQLQEIEALLNYFNIMHRKIKKKHYKAYLQGYNQALSSRDAQIYADAEDEVIASDVIINEIALMRNKFLGILKGLESQNYQLGHIVRLRCAGLSDIQI